MDNMEILNRGWINVSEFIKIELMNINRKIVKSLINSFLMQDTVERTIVRSRYISEGVHRSV